MISNPATVADENGAASGRVTLARQGEEPGPFHPKGPAGQPNKRSRGVCSMTETERKALALVNEVRAEKGLIPYEACEAINTTWFKALCRAIEQHDAFRQEVSDAVEYFMDGPVGLGTARERLGRFITPKPVDPLVEVMRDALSGMAGTYTYEELTPAIRAALAARGLEIRSKTDG